MVVPSPRAVAFLLAAAAAVARPSWAQEGAQAPKRPWGPEQVTSEPDTLEAGDKHTAWAALLPDGGEEWLHVGFERAVAIAEARIRETWNPGAVVKVTAFPEGGGETILWEGRDPTAEAPGDLVVRAREDGDVQAKALKIHLDTARVAGWNEIDAVLLIGKDGSRQWASEATASSTHAGPVPRRGVVLAPQQALEKARVERKYDTLLRKILVEDDVLTYREFRDYGFWAGRVWRGHTDLPPGCWVYVYPHWYIWQVRPVAPQGRRPWGPEQATGEPDTMQAGDFPTAWATRAADAGPEWLRLDYERAVPIAAVRIRETWNPGAVVKVTAFPEGGEETVLWEGRDPTAAAPADLVVRVPDERAVEAKSVKVYLDTVLVHGWNQIDAVALVGQDGTVQWAVRATASSSWAERPRPPVRPPVPRPPVAPEPPRARDPFPELQDRPVKVICEGGRTLDGVFVRTAPDFIVIRQPDARKLLFVNKSRIIVIETLEPADF